MVSPAPLLAAVAPRTIHDDAYFLTEVPGFHLLY